MNEQGKISLNLLFQESNVGAIFFKIMSFLYFHMHQDPTVKISINISFSIVPSPFIQSAAVYHSVASGGSVYPSRKY
jgi:hypothetical protein